MIKILIIDDNKDNLISVTALLKNLEPEYEILTAQSGSEGIQLAQSEQPDTILLDVHMPKMDGYEVCQRLRADQKNNRVPIIFLTAINTTPEDKIKGLEMGGDAYLAKPIDKGELLATLHVMLRIKASEDALKYEKDLLEEKVLERTMELKELNDKYLDSYDNAPDMFVSVDTKTSTILRCNQTLVDALGYTKDEIMGQSIFFVYHSDCIKNAKKYSQQFVNTGEIHDAELQLKRKDGKKIDVSLNVSAVRDEKGNIIYSRSVWRDITERKRGEGALRESKERFRTLIKYAPLGILSIDKTGKILQVNPKLLEILDSPSTETTMSINIFKFPLLQKAGVSGDFEKAIEERTPVENEVKYTSQWGKTTFIRYVLTPNFDENNDIVGAIGSFEDISERKQAEIALDEKTMMLDNLLKSSIDVAIATTDLDFRITYYNPLAEIYFGYAVQEVIGKKVQDVHTKEKVAPERFEQAIMKVKQIGEYIYFVDQKTPGGIRHLKSRVSGIHDLEGKLTGFALFTRDITKQKQLEDKIVSERDKFDSILEDLPIGVTVIDSDDKYVYINPMTMKIDGYKADPESLIGEDMRNIHPKGTLPNIEKLLNDFKSGKKTYFSRDSKRGERSIEISYHAIHDIEGEYQGLTRLVSDITERKQASEALGKSEEKLRTLVSAITDVILVFNDEGRYIEIPQTNPSLLYKPSNEMLGKTLHEVFPVEQADIFLNKIQHTIEIQKTIEMEYCLLINDRNIWFLGKLYPMQSNLVLFVASDITERKLSEQQLHASEEKYRQLIENANEAIYVAQDGKLVFANPMVNYLLGYKNEKLFSSPFTDFIHPDDQKMVYESYVKRLKGEKVKDNYIFRIVNKNGDSKWLSIRSINIIWEGKYATLNFSTNITDRVIIDKALRESEERYRNVVDVSPYAILIHIDGKVVFANQSCGDLFGASNTDDLLDKPIIEYVHPDDRDIAIARIAEMSRSDKAVPLIEERMLRLDGKIIFVEVTATPIIHEEKQAILVILRDITERKHAAEEKAQLEQQIRESQKVESIGRLAGGIAHDFNNMLSVIIGYGDAVLNKLPQEDPLREDVEEIIKAGQRSAALTRQLLAFSRRQTLQPEVLNLNDLILNLEKMLRSVIEEHIDLELPLYKDLANVIADPGQIEQVIMNLIVNARDAMPEGGKLIIETANVELDEAYTKKHAGSTLGKFVMIAITDSGTGMDKETLEQIFEPFFTTKIKEKGTGLGLPTVYGIVKQSGGYIWVDSKPGKGTVVKIFLPQTTSQKSEKEKIDENKNLQGGGKHILIVEDEESVRSLVKDMLVSMDYKISLAANGIEALQLVKDGLKPDLILTDVIMPEMGGAELKTHILKIHPDLKVIFMSGYSDNAIGRQGEIDSTFNFIQKPFTAHDLFTKIHGVLQNEKVERPKKRILMIDDDHQFCELANRFFTRKGYNFVMVETTAAALATLTEQSIDVLLVDMNLPGTNGKLVLEAIRKAGHTAPAIILSGDLYFVNMDELRPLGAVDAIEKSSDFKPVMRMIEKIETK